MKRASICRKTGQLASFTLVEVLLALTIFSMVLVSIYTSWSSIMRGTKIGLDAAAAVQRSRVAVQAIEEALTTAQIYSANPQHYWFVAETEGEFAAFEVIAKVPETFPGSGLYGDQSLRRVSFKVEPGEFSRNDLVLRQWALLTPPNMGPDSEPYKIVLGRDVDRFKMQFWDPVKKDWVEEWSQTNVFPPLVQISIGMGNKESVRMDDREIVSRVIAPPSIVVPRQYQMPGIPVQPGLPGVGATNQPMPIDPNQPFIQPGINPGMQPGYDPRMQPGRFNQPYPVRPVR